MENNNAEAKDRILAAVVSLLQEHKDVTKITNRQIAAMAGVNSAMINYYYRSKENLLNKAVGICMKSISGELFEKSHSSIPPAKRLKNMIKSISTFALDNYELSSIAISYEFKSGDFNTSRIIFPILKEIFAESKSDMELKLMALQLVAPIQILFMNVKAYKDYLSQDVYDESTRNKLIDIMVDNILHAHQKS